MESFETAFQHVLLIETSDYTENEHDRGGPTRYGITIKTLSAYLGYQATSADVRSLSVATARAIYRRYYWDVLSLDMMPPSIAISVFDQAVNRGPYQAALSLQNAVRVIPDGRIGPVTIAACKTGFEREIILSFCQFSLESYIGIVKSYPDQIVNLRGWARRLFSLIDRFCLG